MRGKDVAKWVAEVIATFIAWQLLAYVQILLSSGFLASEKDIILGIIGIGTIVVAISIALTSFVNWIRTRRSISVMHLGEKEKLACTTDLIKQIQTFINEPPKKRVFVGTHIDQQWLREKAVNLNQLVATAKGLIGSEFNMDDFTVNPDLLAQTNVDWRMNPNILPQMDVAWGHLVRLAQKLQGELEVYKREVKPKESIEKIEEKPKTGEVAIVEIIKPELSHLKPLIITSFPAEGWIGVKVVNDGDIEYEGCRGKVKTDVDEFSLFDWEEFQRNSDRTYAKSAEPYMSFTLGGHETKRLYTQVKTNTAQLSVTLEIDKKPIKKELHIPKF